MSTCLRSSVGGMTSLLCRGSIYDVRNNLSSGLKWFRAASRINHPRIPALPTLTTVVAASTHSYLSSFLHTRTAESVPTTPNVVSLIASKHGRDSRRELLVQERRSSPDGGDDRYFTFLVELIVRNAWHHCRAVRARTSRKC